MVRYIQLTLFVLILVVLFILPVLAQVDTAAVGLPPIAPPGFNFWYIAIFALGMVFHWFKKVVQAAGSFKAFLKSPFLAQFAGWFFNKFHATAITGAAAAIAGLASQYELNINFAVLNPLGIGIAIATGFIADSLFNSGTTPEKVIEQMPPKE
jgi:hypothetical protein